MKSVSVASLVTLKKNINNLFRSVPVFKNDHKTACFFLATAYLIGINKSEAEKVTIRGSLVVRRIACHAEHT